MANVRGNSNPSLQGRGLSLAKIAGELNTRNVPPLARSVGSLVGAECPATARSLNPRKFTCYSRVKMGEFICR
jgi:hypothetical protein